MSSVPVLPQVADIAPVQSAANQGIATSQNIMDLVAPIAQQANMQLPEQYTQGKQVSTPTLPHEHQFETNRNTNNVPITGQVADVKRARRQNAVANLSNAIGKAGQEIQAKKMEQLKDKLTDVMKAKTNVANAEQVLSDPNASDQTKQMANKVLMANKKQLDAILSDPKHQKQLAKALDISFVDPEKNKTPEVQAFQAAKKEFDSAGPFKSDNPQEHAVAQAANGGSQQQQPKQMQPNMPQMGAPTQTPVTKAAATPYADKALAKDLPSIEANPLYAQAAAQKAAAQKQIATMLPHLIDSQSKALIQEAKDGNASARAVYNDAMAYQRNLATVLGRLQGVEDTNKARIKAQGMRDATEMAATSMRVAASLKIAEGHDNAHLKAAAAKSVADDIDKKINSIQQIERGFGQRENDIKTLPKDQQAAAQKEFDVEKDLTQQRLNFYQNQKRKALGLPELSKEEQKPKEEPGFWSKALDKIANFNEDIAPGKDKKDAGTESKPVAVGSDNSDESDDNEPDSDDDDDSDHY